MYNYFILIDMENLISELNLVLEKLEQSVLFSTVIQELQKKLQQNLDKLKIPLKSKY